MSTPGSARCFQSLYVPIGSGRPEDFQSACRSVQPCFSAASGSHNPRDEDPHRSPTRRPALHIVWCRGDRHGRPDCSRKGNRGFASQTAPTRRTTTMASHPNSQVRCRSGLVSISTFGPKSDVLSCSDDGPTHGPTGADDPLRLPHVRRLRHCPNFRFPPLADIPLSTHGGH